MNEFVDGVNNDRNWTKTANDADALKSTTNSLLDLFGTIGALRLHSERAIEDVFSTAFGENALLALKMSFYARNIRGGLGERRTARIIWKWLATYQPEVMSKNLHLVPVFGRWDDMYVFVGTHVENSMWKIVTEQFWKDWYAHESGEGEVSLLAKWLKSVNTSNKESVRLGKLTSKNLGFNLEKSYRKTLSKLRKHIDVVERKMSSKNWTDINYSGVPSNAMMNYRKAFGRNDQERFSQYMEDVKSGVKTIHSSTLYPYNIVEKILYDWDRDPVLEEQWKALPNYVEGENNMLVMADVSGSMNGRPMATSIGLAIYFAERNKGAFSNLFMTFSANPEFVKLQGRTLFEKINNAKSANWDMNTDVEKAFMKILSVAVENDVPKEHMPISLIIISDMQFDRASGYCLKRKTINKIMEERFNRAGYDLPKVIYWNVNASKDTFHATIEDNVQFASGQATSVFKSIISNSSLGAYEMMVEVLEDKMYKDISL